MKGELIIPYFYDTCTLLRLQESAFKDFFYVSAQTFQELEEIKTNARKDAEVKASARKLLRLFAENMGGYEIRPVTQDTYEELVLLGLNHEPDQIIIACASVLSGRKELVFATDDLSCYMMAVGCGLNAELQPAIGKNEEYKGYKIFTGTSEEINEYMDHVDLSQWYVNEYLILHNTDDNKTTEMRFDGERFVALKLPPSTWVKAKNSLQRCALDLLMNKEITAVGILGGYGSGKTMLSMLMGLYHVTEKGNQEKVVGIREAKGEGAEIGFLPGRFEQKTGNFFRPLEQQLKGGSFEFDSLMQRGLLETQIPYYMKGTTYNNSFMIVDEAEDLTESQIKLIGTRVGKESRIVFAGDYKQSLICKNLNNPLVKMCYELRGNPAFGCIVLDEDVRSDTSKMFAELFQK